MLLRLLMKNKLKSLLYSNSTGKKIGCTLMYSLKQDHLKNLTLELRNQNNYLAKRIFALENFITHEKNHHRSILLRKTKDAQKHSKKLYLCNIERPYQQSTTHHEQKGSNGDDQEKRTIYQNLRKAKKNLLQSVEHIITGPQVVQVTLITLLEKNSKILIWGRMLT